MRSSFNLSEASERISRAKRHCRAQKCHRSHSPLSWLFVRNDPVCERIYHRIFLWLSKKRLVWVTNPEPPFKKSTGEISPHCRFLSLVVVECILTKALFEDCFFWWFWAQMAQRLQQVGARVESQRMHFCLRNFVWSFAQVSPRGQKLSASSRKSESAAFSIFKGALTMKCTLWTETLEFLGWKVPNSRFSPSLIHGVRHFCPQFTVYAPFSGPSWHLSRQPLPLRA